MSDLKKYSPPPRSADLYMAASKHFQQAKLILENVTSPDAEVKFTNITSPDFIGTFGIEVPRTDKVKQSNLHAYLIIISIIINIIIVICAFQKQSLLEIWHQFIKFKYLTF